MEILASEARAAEEEYNSYDYEPVDIVKDIFGFFLTVAVVFAWVMVMLLILSFVTLSYLHFDIKWMFAASVLCAIGAGVLSLRHFVKKYKGKRIRKSRPRN